MGFVYLIGSPREEGLNRFVVGCSESEDPAGIYKELGTNTLVYCMVPNVSDPKGAEEEVNALFERKFRVHQDRFFIGDLPVMISLFVETVLKWNTKDSPNTLHDKAVRDFLEERVTLTDDAEDLMTTYELYEMFKLWWPLYTNRPVMDLYEFNEYVREALPKDHREGKRSFVGVKVGLKKGAGNPEMKAFLEDKFELTNDARDFLFTQDIYERWAETTDVHDKKRFLNLLKRTVPDELMRRNTVIGFVPRKQDLT